MLRRKLFFEQSEELKEKFCLSKIGIFNDAEVIVQETEQNEKNIKTDETLVKEHTRKSGGKKPLPEDLPREEIVHYLSAKAF